MTLTIRFDNSYARLPARFHARLSPTPVASPQLVALNEPLARSLGLDPAQLASPEGLAMLAGNLVPEGAEPLAQAYAGHQFGGWSPQLGDGRALLLGEVLDITGRRFDLQLKGAGPTPFSRRGDGRAWLGPVLREYLVSEAMFALGVPTTRALAAVTTGEWVLREEPLPGAVLTRVASSHIRVGTFQYFAARGDTEALALLVDHVIARHYPHASGALGLLDCAVAAQARLVAHWMSLGFIHGVMNTDNAHVGGDTIDYGPCAFMDAYHPSRVFSSIDSHGRYAFGNQPNIAVWNMAQLATAMLPLMGEQSAAIDLATEAVQRFAGIYEAEWLMRFRAKLGLVTADDGDADLISDLLARMAAQGADFTRTFHGLSNGTARDEFTGPDAFDHWQTRWLARKSAEPDPGAQQAALRQANPALIARNHQIEALIRAAVQGDFAPFHRMAQALQSPFDPTPQDQDLMVAPYPDEVVERTFCGT